MRILHVAQPIPPGGVLNVVDQLVEDHVSRGWDVHVACPPASELVQMVRERCVVHAWPAGRSPGSQVPLEAIRLGRVVRHVSPELVHLHSAKAGLAGRLSIRGSLPTVYQPHGWSFKAVEGLVRRATVGWERFAARWADRIFCVSEDERRTAAQVGIQGRLDVTPNGVPVAEWPLATPNDRLAARARLGLSAQPIALFVGRLEPAKGADLLLDWWPDIVASVPSAELVIVGDGGQRAGLEARDEPNVTFVGHRSDVGTWIAAADVLVVPSRYEAGLSLAVMEAMARGRSVVAAAVEGMGPGIGDAGEVVPVGDGARFTAAVARRLGDRSRADAEGLRGRDRIVGQFDLSATTERVADIYRDILAVRRGSAGG